MYSRDPAEYDPAFMYKTSLVFTLDEGSGQLFKALSVFALREMSITKIESRPLRSNPILATQEGARQFNYIFFLDYIGHTSELKCKQAMRHRKYTHTHSHSHSLTSVYYSFLLPSYFSIFANVFLHVFYFFLLVACALFISTRDHTFL